MRKLENFDNDARRIPEDYDYEKNAEKSFERDAARRPMRKLADFDTEYEYERIPEKSFERDVGGTTNYEYDLLGKLFVTFLNFIGVQNYSMFEKKSGIDFNIGRNKAQKMVYFN